MQFPLIAAGQIDQNLNDINYTFQRLHDRFNYQSGATIISMYLLSGIFYASFNKSFLLCDLHK